MLRNLLKGSGGEYEINRVVGAFGAGSYVIVGNGLVIWEVLVKSRPFDIVAYCTAFPAGLAIAVSAIAGAVAVKDRAVAKAKLDTVQAENNSVAS